jgi:hypothetical protein
MWAAGGHGYKFYALHQHALRDKIRAHLTRTNNADAHRFSFVCAPSQFSGKSCQCDIGHAGGSPDLALEALRMTPDVSGRAAHVQPVRTNDPSHAPGQPVAALNQNENLASH